MIQSTYNPINIIDFISIRGTYLKMFQLTTNMVAPIKMALVSSVAFVGKLTLKVSLSVNTSVQNPIHCLDIVPTSIPESAPKIFGEVTIKFFISIR